MRTRLALALILCMAAPPIAWTAAPDSSPAAGTSSLAAPAGGAWALVRNSATAEKTCAADWTVALHPQPHLPSSQHTVVRVERAVDLPHLDLDNPPLAPRPPPLS
jgi:hypothetical protein